MAGIGSICAVYGCNNYRGPCTVHQNLSTDFRKIKKYASNGLFGADEQTWMIYSKEMDQNICTETENTTRSFQEQKKLCSAPAEKADREKTLAGDRSYKMPREGKRKSADRCRERSGWCKDDKSRKRSCSRSPGRGHRDTKRRSSPQYSKHGAVSDSRRLSCRLFIGNLPKGTRKADLVEFFNCMLRKSGICQGPADPIEDCYVVRDQFAFIQCRTVEEMTVVLSFNGCNFQGNSLKIERPLGHKESAGMKKAQPFGGGVLINPWATTPDPSTKESHTLWIWNIPIGVLGEKVAEFFNNLMIISGFARGPGESVVNCRVILGKEYYTLELRSVEEATRAMLLNGVSFMGSRLTITRPNEPRPVEGNAALRDTLSAAVLPVSARLDCIIYVTNITPGAKVDEMVKLFNQQMHLSGLAQTLGDPIVAYQFNPLKNIAFIEFRTAVEARGAVALNGIAYLGRNLKIGRINEFQQLGANCSHESTPQAGVGGEKLTSCSVAPKESCRLYVGNIPPGHRDVSKLQEELKIFFNEQMSIAGLKLAAGAPVTSVQFQPNATYAFIEFRSLEETSQALSLDGISFHNRELKIKRPNNYKPSPEKGRNADHSHPEELGEKNRHCSLSSMLERKSLGRHRDRLGEEEPIFPLSGQGELTLSSAAPKESCRLYVGNIPPGYKDISKLRDELKLFFNQQMNLAGLRLASGNPIIGVWVHPNSKYAFLEFRSMEETTKAMSLDGISFNNRMLHIKRPSNYKPPQGTKEVVSSRSDCPLRISCNSHDNEFQSKEKSTSALFLGGMNHSHRSPNYTISDFPSGALRELSSGSAGRSDCKLCIGNFPYGITEVELIEFFNKVMHQTGLSEGIGDAVISCKIVPDTNFAHIEFRSPSEATKALILDDISFRGEKMKIKRPFDPQSLDADVGFQSVRIQEDSSSVSGIHRLTNRNEMLPVNDSGLYPAQQKTKAVGFTPGNSQMSDPIPAIDSIISRSEVTTSQVLKHVADFQQRGYFGGTEFTAVANLLSVNISVCCANGTKMTYHPNAGPASATVEIQSSKMSSPPVVHGTNQGTGLQGLASSASWDISYPSVDVQIQGHQADNLKQSSSFPSSGSNTPPRCWENSYSSMLTAGVPLKALETTRGTPTHGETNWLIATWNVRGANSVEKQCAIDEIMYSKAVAVAALQESYLPSSCFDTSHYKWLLSANSRQSSQSGVGFLVRRDLASMINRWTSISDYLACLHLRINGQSIAVVTVCIPSDDTIAAATLKNLLSIVSVLPSTSHIFVVGDFNAQIGSDDLKEISKTYIGHRLGHLHSNKNGVRLVNILRECRLYLLSSLFGNSSTIVTWSKGSVAAQVDHILGNCPSSVSQVAACFVPMVDTDHKLIWAITSVLSCSKHSITVNDFSK